MPMAWLMAEPDVETGDASPIDDLMEEPDAQTINYWALRLTPLLEAANHRDFYFISCNRTGTEQQSRFAGSSCALHFGPASGHNSAARQVELVGAMGRREAVQVFQLS